MEAGVHSIWVSEQLQELGHEVIVANVRELRAISHSDRKSDQVDAETLARYARLDPNILRPISLRTVEQQEALTVIRSRELLVPLRTAAVNAVRGLTKACGYRMPASSTHELLFGDYAFLVVSIKRSNCLVAAETKTKESQTVDVVWLS
jgi:transposase